MVGEWTLWTHTQIASKGNATAQDSLHQNSWLRKWRPNTAVAFWCIPLNIFPSFTVWTQTITHSHGIPLSNQRWLKEPLSICFQYYPRNREPVAELFPKLLVLWLWKTLPIFLCGPALLRYGIISHFRRIRFQQSIIPKVVTLLTDHVGLKQSCVKTNSTYILPVTV